MKEIFLNKSGQKLFGFIWEVAEPIAVVLLIHGIGEHVGRYQAMSSFFNRRKVAVLGIDRPGDGKSTGKRGHAKDFGALLNSVDWMLEIAEENFGELPIFLYGQSMGGNIGLNYAIKRKQNLSGVIISSPWIRLVQEPSGLLKAMAKLGNVLYPKFSQSNGLNIAHLSRSKEIVQYYADDAHVHDKITLSTGHSMIKAADFLDAFSGKVGCPVLLLHGDTDQITDHTGTLDFYNRNKQNDLTLKIWQGLFHELHNEPEWENVLDFVYNWILKKI